MSDQLSLFDSAPTPPKPAAKKPERSPADFNVFLALMPDEPDALRIRDLAQRLKTDLGMSRHPIDEDRLHISIFGVAAFNKPLPLAELNGLLDRLDAALAQLDEPSIDVVFDHVTSFGHATGGKPRPLVLTCDEPSRIALSGLEQRLFDRISDANDKKRRYTPHMSLLYDRKGILEQPVPPVSWRARKLVLVLSHYNRSQYDRLREWLLG